MRNNDLSSEERADLVIEAQGMIDEAIELLRQAVLGSEIEGSANAYLIPALVMAARDEHEYLGRNQCTAQYVLDHFAGLAVQEREAADRAERFEVFERRFEIEGWEDDEEDDSCAALGECPVCGSTLRTDNGDCPAGCGFWNGEAWITFEAED